MNDPKGARESWGEGAWHAFGPTAKRIRLRQTLRARLARQSDWGFARKLAVAATLGSVFRKPVRYKATGHWRGPNLPELVFNPESWRTDENDKAEARLRTALLELCKKAADGTTAREADAQVGGRGT